MILNHKKGTFPETTQFQIWGILTFFKIWINWINCNVKISVYEINYLSNLIQILHIVKYVLSGKNVLLCKKKSF